jgi:hypothetical protein
VLGIQELASVVFSLLNGLYHLRILAYRRAVPSSTPMYYVWHVVAVVGGFTVMFCVWHVVAVVGGFTVICVWHVVAVVGGFTVMFCVWHVVALVGGVKI